MLASIFFCEEIITRKITEDELKMILERHEHWVKGGKEMTAQAAEIIKALQTIQSEIARDYPIYYYVAIETAINYIDAYEQARLVIDAAKEQIKRLSYTLEETLKDGKGVTVTGYKAFNSDFTCRGFQYNIGETYELDEEDGDIELCNNGFHFCEKMADCFNYYPSLDARFAKVEALGRVMKSSNNSKCVTDKIKILEEIPRETALAMSNIGDFNSGTRNTGDYNRGTGNTGHFNVGHYSTGNFNAKAFNTGNYNTGIGNTGNRNAGTRNTGHFNEGDFNTGDHNIGDWNSGDWNMASFTSGCFMTEDQNIMMFNKPTDWTYIDWIDSNARHILNDSPFIYTEWVEEDKMSDEEKAMNPCYKDMGGYLKIFDKRDSRQSWWDTLPVEEQQEVMSLPNFDADIFYGCTGIKVNNANDKEKGE